MDITPVASGQWGSVVWAVDGSNKTPALEFFLDLNKNDRAKIQSLFNRFADFGRIGTSERFKKLRNLRGWTLWEFKSFQIRFIGAFSPWTPRTFLVAHGLKKKKDRHRKRDLDKAVRILEEYSVEIRIR